MPLPNQPENPDDKFRPGDVVCLKSGGSKMTIEARDKEYPEPHYKVIWFDQCSRLHRDTFPEDILEAEAQIIVRMNTDMANEIGQAAKNIRSADAAAHDNPQQEATGG